MHKLTVEKSEHGEIISSNKWGSQTQTEISCVHPGLVSEYTSLLSQSVIYSIEIPRSLVSVTVISEFNVMLCRRLVMTWWGEPGCRNWPHLGRKKGPVEPPSSWREVALRFDNFHSDLPILQKTFQCVWQKKSIHIISRQSTGIKRSPSDIILSELIRYIPQKMELKCRSNRVGLLINK